MNKLLKRGGEKNLICNQSNSLVLCNKESKNCCVQQQETTKTTEVNDDRILSFVKKTPFTTSTEIKNTLERMEILSNFKMKRCLH